ncbi:hypothetical protein [Paenibacillus sp. JCM 10914]|uniref:hypothetical protein n=1 Tax=Paenibacillus sp. JCM 10914 TaxID=1236974 RepID=UPI001E551BBE|nr:hypothetical protein [Paenibacillus sp. JCM 10914]
MSLKILKPGMLATIQDLGRYAYGKYGIIAAGAMDATRAKSQIGWSVTKLTRPCLRLHGPVWRWRFRRRCGCPLPGEIYRRE